MVRVPPFKGHHRRKRRYKLITIGQERMEVYDLQQDPWEMDNLILTGSAPVGVAQELEQQATQIRH